MSVAFPLEIFYDGSCVICSTEMQVYRRRNPKNRLRFIDISAEDFNPKRYGKSQDEFMAKLHARDAEGNFVTGVDAFMLIWQAFPDGSPYRLLSAVVGLPGFHLLSRGSYALFSRYRHLLPKRGVECENGNCRMKHPR